MVKTLKILNVIENNGRTVVLVLIYFLFLYSFQIPGLPFGTLMISLSTLSICIVYAYLRGKTRYARTRTTMMVRSYLIWNAFLLVYVFCLLQLFGRGNGATPLKDYVMMLVILPLFYISGNFIFKNIEELMKILYYGVIIQSIIIVAALFIPPLASGLTLLFREGALNSDKMGGFEDAIAYGYHMGLGVFTSEGSLKMAIGLIGSCYFLMKSRGINLLFHIVIYLLIAVATTVVSRTGLLISVVGLLIVIIAKKNQGGHRAFSFISLLFFLLLTGYFAINAYISADLLSDSFVRISRTMDKGLYGSYFEKYSGNLGENVIPPICLETIIGLGITSGTSGNGITTITDGGFMRNYSAMGLVVAIINYVIIALYFVKQYKASITNEYKRILLFILIVFLIGEFKEYYIYYYSPMCFAFMIMGLIEREEKRTQSVFSNIQATKL